MSDTKSQSDDPAAQHKPGEASGSEPGKVTEEEKKSGRVSFDSRGNAVWEWQMKTGIYGQDVDTKRLKKLEANLQIADDPLSTGKRRKQATQARKQSGFDPYNSSAPPVKPSASSTPPRSSQAVADKDSEDSPEDTARRPGLLGRLFGRKD